MSMSMGIHQLGALRTTSRRRPIFSAIRIRRSPSSSASANPPPSSAKTAVTPSHTSPPPLPQILDERTLLSRLSPLKRIVCLCPVPLGRGRVSWSGGDALHPPEDEPIHLDYQSQQIQMEQPPARVAKYRYGERFAIGVAVSDSYLTHAQPVHLGDERADNDEWKKRRFVAEIVPTFRCDAHNLGSSPIFHTNLPYFRNDFLQQIGHSDVGAIVLALPMKPTKNPFCPAPTKVQLEQERKLDQVRECLVGVLQNYMSFEDEEEEEVEEDSSLGNGDDIGGVVRNDGSDGDDNGPNKHHRRTTPLGPLNVQGCIDHRLSVADVLSKTDNDCHRGSWDDISRSLRQIQHSHTTGRTMHGSGNGGGNNYFFGNREHAAHDVFSSVPPEMHAAVALNAMMEKYTSGYHNSFF